MTFLLMGCYEAERSFEATAPNLHAVEENEAALEAMSSDKLEEALALVDQAVKRAPDFAGFYVNKAIIQTRMGKLKQAVATLDRCLESPEVNTTPNDMVQIQLLRGIVFEKLEQIGDAQRAYEGAINQIDIEENIEAGELNLVIKVAIAQYLRGGTVGGLRSLNQLLQTYPDNHTARMAKARMLANDRDYFVRWATAPVEIEDPASEGTDATNHSALERPQEFVPTATSHIG